MSSRSNSSMEVTRKREAGFTLIEVTMAVAVLGLGALLSMGTMVQASVTDEEVREEMKALRAGLTAMEEVTSYDYDGDIQNFIDYWSDAQNANFAVNGLNSPEAEGTDGEGAVAIDATDPNQIVVTVTVTWSSRRGVRTMQLPMRLTETEQ